VANRAEGEPQHIPCSTYRLQLNRFLTFAQAEALLDYLQELGISDCYTSPFLMARPGSLHGYDITDPTRLNPEIGTEQEFQSFADHLRKRGMGLVADVVPNHMCIVHPSNTWWWDVLENGPSSPFSPYFDIDWHPPKAELANKVLLPFLADQFGRALENQHLALHYDAGAFFINCQGTWFPVAPGSWPLILHGVLQQMHERLGTSDAQVLELESILTAISHLPPRDETDPDKIQERQREKEIVKRRLATLVDQAPTFRAAMNEVLCGINGRTGDSHSFDRLERLLANQGYRFSYWRVAADEINYRRFFDVNELAAIRVEDPDVFDRVHALIFDLVRKGCISGVRIDHPDGLFDPQGYFQYLQEQVPVPVEAPANTQPAYARRRIFVMAEKVLVGKEVLRPSWAIEGTTGYGFLNLLNGLFVDSARKRALLRLYKQFTGWSQSYFDLVYECKRLVLQVSLSSELTVLSRRLDRVAEQHRWSRDFTLDSLRDALHEVIACFPVYRTYIRENTVHPDEEDQQYIRSATVSAKRRNAAVSGSVFDFIQDVLMLNDPDGISDADKAERRLFVMRFQQLTGSVMAKGLEDTAFYRYCPLLSLNEVGGSARPFGVSTASFHARNLERQALWRNSVLTTSTHDHKRSEDVRARINALSEIPAEWYRAIRSWQRLNAGKRVPLTADTVPNANEEYFLYQTLIGAWPMSAMTEEEYVDFTGRIHAYMEKSLREAKIHTSWVNPNSEYEAAFHGFLTAILEGYPDSAFLAEFLPFQARIAKVGIFNSLSQVLLKVTSPGIPDFYQGTETWNFTLTDPDNRRHVDYGRLRSLLTGLPPAGSQNLACQVSQLLRSAEDGRIKLYLTRAALRYRRASRTLFAQGSYTPLRAIGERSRHIVAFARSFQGKYVVVMTGRLFAQLGADKRPPLGKETWGDTAVVVRKQFANRSYREILTNRAVAAEKSSGHLVLPVSEVFSHLPVALLTNDEGPYDAD